MKKNNENLVQDNFYKGLWMDYKAKPVGAPPTLVRRPTYTTFHTASPKQSKPNPGELGYISYTSF